VLRSFASTTGLALAAPCAAQPALAVQVCELNGQPVNPSNGYTTEGTTGLMRCRDGEGGPVVREQELQRGKFTGVVRYFEDGVLEREHDVNERGNQDGLAREWSRAEPGGKPVLIKEETYRDGRNTGIARGWYPSGQLKRVADHADDDREQAVAELNAQGQLAEPRCATRPMLGSDFDDKTACGHAGAASTVTLYARTAGWNERPTGTHQSFDAEGRLRAESIYDERGRIKRERELDERGTVLRDDEVFEDGSRKAVGR
jgi:hypothetical protein